MRPGEHGIQRGASDLPRRLPAGTVGGAPWCCPQSASSFPGSTCSIRSPGTGAVSVGPGARHENAVSRWVKRSTASPSAPPVDAAYRGNRLASATLALALPPAGQRHLLVAVSSASLISPALLLRTRPRRRGKASTTSSEGCTSSSRTDLDTRTPARQRSSRFCNSRLDALLDGMPAGGQHIVERRQPSDHRLSSRFPWRRLPHASASPSNWPKTNSSGRTRS